jgi:hypothetical protein
MVRPLGTMPFFCKRLKLLYLEVHDRVKVRELGAVNQDSGLDGVKGVVLDPFSKVVDLHGFINILNSELKESGQSIVLLHVDSTVLVEVVVLAVTTVEQGFEGQDDVAVHGVDPVTPKEEGAGFARPGGHSAWLSTSSHAAMPRRWSTGHGGLPKPSLRQ